MIFQITGSALGVHSTCDGSAIDANLRRHPIEDRKTALAKLLRNAKPGLQLNEHISEPGDVVFRHACELSLEGIVSKRLGSRYRSGRSREWAVVTWSG